MTPGRKVFGINSDCCLLSCSGKRYLGKNTCASKCKVADLDKLSGQTVQVKCYSKNGTEKISPIQVEPDDYCEVQCSGSEQAYPDTRSTCLVSSKWTNALDCLAVCQPENVVSSGTLEIGASSKTQSLLNMKTRCFKDGQPVLEKPYFEGTTCTYDQGVCGNDQEGYIYYQTQPDVKCSTSGSWESDGSIVSGPICTSHPCPLLKVESITGGVGLDCKFDDVSVSGNTSVKDSSNEGVSCTLTSCVKDYKPLEPSRTVCGKGVWEPTTLSCTTTTTPCEISSLSVANGVTDCSEATKVEGNQGQVLGGETCEFSCNTGYVKEGVAQCIGPKWSDKVACGK